MRVLRAHHLLCIHGFQGKGYSPEFVAEMGAIVSEMRDKGINFPVQVVHTLDDICFHCPNRQDPICAPSEQHVQELDQRVMRHLGLKHAEIYEKNDLIRRTVERVDTDDLDHLCAGCSWLPYGYCKAGIRSLKGWCHSVSFGP